MFHDSFNFIPKHAFAGILQELARHYNFVLSSFSSVAASEFFTFWVYNDLFPSSHDWLLGSFS